MITFSESDVVREWVFQEGSTRKVGEYRGYLLQCYTWIEVDALLLWGPSSLLCLLISREKQTGIVTSSVWIVDFKEGKTVTRENDATRKLLYQNRLVNWFTRVGIHWINASFVITVNGHVPPVHSPTGGTHRIRNALIRKNGGVWERDLQHIYLLQNALKFYTSTAIWWNLWKKT